MRIIEILLKVWTWRRDRATRELRARWLKRMEHSGKLYFEENKEILAFIMEAPLRRWKQREELLIFPGPKLSAQEAIRLTRLREKWVNQGEGIQDLRKGLEVVWGSPIRPGHSTGIERNSVPSPRNQERHKRYNQK